MGGLEFGFPWGGVTTPNSGTGGIGGGGGGSVGHSGLPLSAVEAVACEDIGGCILGS